MKLVCSKYDNKTGISTCTVEHLGEKFTKHSTLNEKDRKYESNFRGCKIAEMKAEISALKYERKIERMKCEVCRHFVTSCIQTNKFDKNCPTAKVCFRQLKIRIRNVNRLTDKINNRIMTLRAMMVEYDVITKALNRKKEEQF